MKKILTILMAMIAFQCAYSQSFTPVREYYINESSIGNTDFFQADFNGDGNIDFLSDANDQRNIFAGHVWQKDIMTLITSPLYDQYDLWDLRYEDTDLDGRMEIYMMQEYVGLIRFDTSTFLPVDTFESFSSLAGYEKMILMDTDLDGKNEWILMHDSKGLFIIDPSTEAVISSNPLIEGRNFHLANLDEEPTLELVLVLNRDIQIIDFETFAVEHTITGVNPTQTVLEDMNHDGHAELVIRDQQTIKLYSHLSKSVIGTYTASSSFDFENFITLNLDEDPNEELILYRPGSNSLIELQTYPVVVGDKYAVEGVSEFGKFLAKSILTPGSKDLIFNYDDQFAGAEGLIFFNPFTRTALVTNATGNPNAILIDRLGNSEKEFLITKPSLSNEVINIRSLDDFHTEKQIFGEDIFDQYSINLGPIYTTHTKGLNNNLIFITNNSTFSYYDFNDDAHKEYYHYDFEKVIIEDINYDGHQEMITLTPEGIHVFTRAEDLNYESQFSTIPVPFNFKIKVAQLNASKEKEIIAYDEENIFVFSGSNGALIGQLAGLFTESIQNFVPFSDGQGVYYLALIDEQRIYIHNFTINSPVRDFEYSEEDYSKNGISVFQVHQDTLLETYVAVLADSFKVFTTDGNQVYATPDELPGNPRNILVSDYDQDLKANLVTSSYFKYAEYEYSGPGEFHRSFYTTDIFPLNASTVNQVSPFILQFSEAVDLNTINGNVMITSKNSGNLNFSYEQISAHQISIKPQLDASGPDTISMILFGRLQSKLAKFLDINYDDISLGQKEDSLIIQYFLDPSTQSNPLSISPASILPDTIYNKSIRYIPFTVSSDPVHGPSIPIASVHSGIRSPFIHPAGMTLPIDSVFDEVTEEVNIPVNTFSLQPGDYQVYVVANDFHGHESDTFFFNVAITEETGYYDKNAANGDYRTFSTENPLTTSNIKLVHTISHDVFNNISHVVGGDNSFYYSELPDDSTNGFVRRLDLRNFEILWEVQLPMDFNASSLHLNNGHLYLYDNPDVGTEITLHSFDALTGRKIFSTPFPNDGINDSSPMTDTSMLVIPGGLTSGYYGFDRWNGELKWYTSVGQSVSYEGAATIFKDKVYGSNGRYLYAFDLYTGKIIWKTDLGDPIPFLITYSLIDTLHEQVIITNDGYIAAHDVHTGEENWKKAIYGSPQASLILYQNEVYLFASDSIHVYNATTGQLARQKKLPAFLYNQPVGSNGKLFLPLWFRFDIIDMKTFQTLWTSDLGVTDISIIDQYLFLQTGNRIYIYETLDLCCNPTITWTEATYGISGSATSKRFGFDPQPHIFNGKTYHEIIYNNDPEGGTWIRSGEYLSYQDRSLFSSNLNSESRAADFSLEINDSFQLPNGVMADVVYVDSIQLENGETRRRLELQCDANDRFYWIDGVGSTTGNGSIDLWCNYDIYPTLLCHYQDGELLYMNPDVDTCWLMLTSTNTPDINTVTFSPNPVVDELVIKDPDQVLSSIMITDIYGRILKEGSELRMDVSSLINGIYILNLNHKDGQTETSIFVKL